VKPSVREPEASACALRPADSPMRERAPCTRMWSKCTRACENSPPLSQRPAFVPALPWHGERLR